MSTHNIDSFKKFNTPILGCLSKLNNTEINACICISFYFSSKLPFLRQTLKSPSCFKMFGYNFHIIRQFMQPSLQLFFHHSSMKGGLQSATTAHCYEWLLIFYDVKRIFQIKIRCLPQNKITDGSRMVQQPHRACSMLPSATKTDIKAAEESIDDSKNAFILYEKKKQTKTTRSPHFKAVKCFSLVFPLNSNSKLIQNVALKAPVAMADAPRRATNEKLHAITQCDGRRCRACYPSAATFHLRLTSKNTFVHCVGKRIIEVEDAAASMKMLWQTKTKSCVEAESENMPPANNSNCWSSWITTKQKFLLLL